MNVGSVDCTQAENKVLCSTYEIGGYPTLIYFNDGKYYEYRGARSLEKLEDFAMNEGYLKATQSDVFPQKLEGMVYYMKQFKKFLRELVHATEMIFDKVGLQSL